MLHFVDTGIKVYIVLHVGQIKRSVLVAPTKESMFTSEEAEQLQRTIQHTYKQNKRFGKATQIMCKVVTPRSHSVIPQRGQHVEEQAVRAYYLGEEAFFSKEEAMAKAREQLERLALLPNARYEEKVESPTMTIPVVVCYACNQPISPLGHCGCNAL